MDQRSILNQTGMDEGTQSMPWRYLLLRIYVKPSTIAL